MMWTGIPISIGIAPTKTLAKIANRIAKRNHQHQGVFIYPQIESQQEDILKAIAVEDIWGIGRAYSIWLRSKLINNAYELKNAPIAEGNSPLQAMSAHMRASPLSRLRLIQPKMGIVGVRLVRELNGIFCLSLELQPKPKKATCVSRSFSRPVTELEQMKEAITTHTTTAGAKLRKQKQNTTAITVFILTNRFKDNYYSNSITLPLPIASNRTPELINAALRGLEVIYCDGYEYKKAGVIMQGLQPENIQQNNVFLQNYDSQKQQRLMETIDRLNDRFGKNTVSWAASGINQSWVTKRDRVSPRYTTNWNELPVVKASFWFRESIT